MRHLRNNKTVNIKDGKITPRFDEDKLTSVFLSTVSTVHSVCCRRRKLNKEQEKEAA